MGRPVDLAAEWASATAAVRQRHLGAMRHRYGIPPMTIIDRLGTARVRVEGEHYVPDDDGAEMVLIAAFAAPPRLDGRWRAPNPVVDLIAFRPAEPARWWSRSGLAGVLGEEMIGDFSDDPVRVWPDPLRWLRSGASGVCPVSPDPAAVRDVLLRLPGIVAEDVSHGREIERLLEHHWNRLPPIYVAERALAGAA